MNALTCAKDGEKTARSLFGDDLLWVPYTDPGYRLAKLMEENKKKQEMEKQQAKPLSLEPIPIPDPFKSK